MDEKVYVSCHGFGYSSFSYFCCMDINGILINKSAINEQRRGPPTKSLISQWPIAEENSKSDQFIARTMIYCQVLRYIIMLSGKQDLVNFGEAHPSIFGYFQFFSKFYVTFRKLINIWLSYRTTWQ